MRPAASRILHLRLYVRVMSHLTLAALLALCVASTAAADRHVSTTGSDTSNNCTNSASPCRTIQRAISQVGTDEMIKVQTGTYVENIVINRSLDGVTIIGGWGSGGVGFTNDPSATVINGGGVYPSSTTIRIVSSDSIYRVMA